MTEFIFMLTHQDRTVSNAREALEVALEAGVQHVGFKDVGATPELQKELAGIARAAGATTYLEVVSVTEDDELASVAAGIDAGVDWILGGQYAKSALEVLGGHDVQYAPFCGRTVGHPSTLEGTVEEIAEDTATLTGLDGVDGVDLLAYRHQTADIAQLIKATAARCDGRLIVAGSVTSAEQVQVIADGGGWGFTIGSAVFDDQLDAAPGLAAQIDAALAYATSSR